MWMYVVQIAIYRAIMGSNAIWHHEKGAILDGTAWHLDGDAGYCSSW